MLWVLEPGLWFVHAIVVLRQIQIQIHEIWEGDSDCKKWIGEVMSIGKKLFLSGNIEDTKKNMN